jgi:hypothetical protein
MRNIKKDIYKYINKYGFWMTLGICLKKSNKFLFEFIDSFRNNSIKDEFDEKYGIDTKGKLPLSALDIDTPDWVYGVLYQPTAPDIIKEILSHLKIKYEDFIFIDYGSGKGRVLLLASEFSFKKVIGIEFSRQLHLTAQKNIEIYKSETQKCKNNESICINATEYELLPYPSVIYFYNPFEEKIMRIVLDIIKRSLEISPRAIYVAYFNPVLDDLIVDYGFKRILKSNNNYNIYVNINYNK